MHTTLIRRVVPDAPRNRLITASDDKTIRVWQMPEARLVSVLRVPIDSGHEGQLFGLAISPDGRTIAFVATADDRARLWLRSLESGASRPVVGTDGTSRTDKNGSVVTRRQVWRSACRATAVSRARAPTPARSWSEDGNTTTSSPTSTSAARAHRHRGAGRTGARLYAPGFPPDRPPGDSGRRSPLSVNHPRRRAIAIGSSTAGDCHLVPAAT